MPKAYELSPEVQKAYETLKKVRVSKTVALKPIPRLRKEIEGLDGKPQEFKLRYYQVQGAFHMIQMKRMLLGDSCGLGKTVECIAAFSYLWEKEHQNKVIVVAPKSAVQQWADEIRRFTNGVRPIVVENPKSSKAGGALEARKKAYREWLDAPTGPEAEKVVLIMNYALLIRDWNAEGYQPLKPNGRPDPKQPVVPGVLNSATQKVADTGGLVVILDESTAFKSKKTKTWETAYYLSTRAQRCYGLTATLLKNNLMEGFSIYGVIRPGTFSTQTAFFEDYCYVKMQKAGRKQFPIVTGYKNLEHFRERIDPFYLGRKKQEVSTELPVLTTRELLCELSKEEDSKYEEALSGILELGDGEVRDFEEHKALVSLNYCQQVANSLSLLKFQEGDGIKAGFRSSKEQGLIDLLTGELDDEKVIVYTRYASHVERLQEILKKEKIQSVRITGKESDAERKKNQKAFQDLNSKTKVVFITAAGTEAINLQAAAAMIFFDMPWSWGDYVQALGRLIRIGSPHKGVLAFHLIAKRPTNSGTTGKTIDHHVLGLLRKKKSFIDKIIGEEAKGTLKFEQGEGNSLQQLVKSLQGKGERTSLERVIEGDPV